MKTIQELERSLKEWVRERIRSALMAAIQFSQVERSTATGEDSSSGYPKDVGEPSSQYQHRRMQHYGFRSRPPAGVPIIRLHPAGGASQGASIAEDSERYGPSDLLDGEVAIYASIEGRIIKIDAPGIIHIGGAGLVAADGVVHGTGIDTFSGATHHALGSTSSVVRAKK